MATHSLDMVAHRIGETQQALPGVAAVVLGIGALVLVVLPEAWPTVEVFDVIAHEGSHALVGASLGQRILGVTIERDRSGATGYQPSGALSDFIAALVGYFGPSGFGLGAAKLISLGHVVAALGVALLLLLLLLVSMRNVYGLLLVAICAGLLLLLLLATSVGVQVVTAYAVTWLLLLAGVKSAVTHGTKADDAKSLTKMTHLPRFLWAGIWLAGTGLALAVGGGLLV